MILVDTSVWIDHFRSGDTTLAQLLTEDRVLTHPFVVGELAMGHIRGRDLTLYWLRQLPQATLASDDEVLSFIRRHGLAGTGIGYVDVHLLAATRLMSWCSFWTRDRRLRSVAASFVPLADAV